jgi:hypothetical protein
MPRVYLFNITRKELQFWDETDPLHHTWDTVAKFVPKWTSDESIACNIHVSSSSNEFYRISGHRDEKLSGNYNDGGDLISIDFSLHRHHNKLHVLDFTMLPKLPAKIAPP